MNRFSYVFRAASCINYCRSCQLRSTYKRFNSVRFDSVVAVNEGNKLPFCVLQPEVSGIGDASVQGMDHANMLILLCILIAYAAASVR